MDEPCSALDVEGTRAIEELMFALKGRYTIVIVTHNMAQARRASDECIFMLMGELIEHGRTEDLFLSPRQSQDRRIHRRTIRLKIGGQFPIVWAGAAPTLTTPTPTAPHSYPIWDFDRIRFCEKRPCSAIRPYHR